MDHGQNAYMDIFSESICRQRVKFNSIICNISNGETLFQYFSSNSEANASELLENIGETSLFAKIETHSENEREFILRNLRQWLDTRKQSTKLTNFTPLHSSRRRRITY